MANAFGSGLSNLGNMGMQYAIFNTPAIQQSLGLRGAQTGGTGASQIFNNPAGLDASINYAYNPR
jgi:hypothetical protein